MESNHTFPQVRLLEDDKIEHATSRINCHTLQYPDPATLFVGMQDATGFENLVAAGIEQASKIIAVIPAYNEDRFIGSVVLKTRQYVNMVIVVDDGSTDQTAALAHAAGAMVVRHERNVGKSAALNTGLQTARQMSAGVVVFLDADGQHHPDDIPGLVEPALSGRADVVVGSRFMCPENHIPRWRVFGQHTLTAVTNTLSGVPLTDSQSGFRALSGRAIQTMHFSQDGFAAESEMQFLARNCGLKMIEVPIRVTYAEGPKRSPVAQAMQVINGVLRLVGQIRPLLFFGIPGALMLAAGIGLGWHVFLVYEATKDLAVGHALITVLLTLLGTLSLFTGLTLHSIRGLLLRWADRTQA